MIRKKKYIDISYSITNDKVLQAVLLLLGLLPDPRQKHTLAVYRVPAIKGVYVEIDRKGFFTRYDTTDWSVRAFGTGKNEMQACYVLAAVVCRLVYDENPELRQALTNAAEHNKTSEIMHAARPLADLLHLYGRETLEYSDDLLVSDIKKLFDEGCMRPEYLGFEKKLFAMSYLKRDSSSQQSGSGQTDLTYEQQFRIDCINGKYRIDYQWSDKQRAHIISADYLKNFEMTDSFMEMVNSAYITARDIIKRHTEKRIPYTDPLGYSDLMYNRMLIGKPGTGKSSNVYALSAALGMPVYTVAFSKYTDESVAEGRTKIVNGHPTYIATDIPEFWDKGGIINCEEMNLADPAVTMGVFGQAFEQPFVIEKNGYEKIYRNPFTFVFCCENTGIEGTRPNSPALSNRFPVKWVIGDPGEDVFKSILKKKTGVDDCLIEWVYEAYEKTTNWLKSPKVGEEDKANLLSLRTCIGTVDSIVRFGMDPIRAVDNTIVSAVAEADLALAEQLKSEVICDLRDPEFDAA